MRGRPRTLPDLACEVCGGAFKPRKGNANRFCSPECASSDRHHDEEFVRCARELWDLGWSARIIGESMGVTKNTIIGVAHRNDFPARPSPIKSSRVLPARVTA